MDAILPKEAWKPATASVTNKSGRARGIYLLVVRQFDLKAPRYLRDEKGNTKCNIFVWDVTRAMGAEIPHWVDAEGNPVEMGEGAELNANGCFDWLVEKGQKHGWEPVDRHEAQQLAEAGNPVVAVWKNPKPKQPGHIAMVVPDADGVAPTGPIIAQAGKSNFFQRSLAEGFGKLPVRFFANRAVPPPKPQGVTP